MRLLRAQAEDFLPMLEDSSVAAFHAYFLDPWPKKKQRKRRLLRAPFFASTFPKASTGAPFRIVTDHADYAAAIADSIEEARSAGAAWRLEDWGDEEPAPRTHYEIKYSLAGRQFHRFLLRKP